MFHLIHSGSSRLLAAVIAAAALTAPVRAEFPTIPDWQGANSTIAEWRFDGGETYTFHFNWDEPSPATASADEEFERNYYTINDYFESFTDERIESGTHERGATPEDEEVLTFDSSIFADIFNSDESTSAFSTTEFREPVSSGSAPNPWTPRSNQDSLEDWNWTFDWDAEPVSHGGGADEFDFGWSDGGVNSAWFDQRNQS